MRAPPDLNRNDGANGALLLLWSPLAFSLLSPFRTSTLSPFPPFIGRPSSLHQAPIPWTSPKTGPVVSANPTPTSNFNHLLPLKMSTLKLLSIALLSCLVAPALARPAPVPTRIPFVALQRRDPPCARFSPEKEPVGQLTCSSP